MIIGNRLNGFGFARRCVTRSGGKYDARISESSLDGCFIDSMRQEILSETVDFKLRLPFDSWMTLQGVVDRQQCPVDFEMALRQHLSDDDRRMLVRLIAAHDGTQAQQILNETKQEIFAQPFSTEARRVLLAD